MGVSLNSPASIYHSGNSLVRSRANNKKYFSLFYAILNIDFFECGLHEKRNSRKKLRELDRSIFQQLFYAQYCAHYDILDLM